MTRQEWINRFLIASRCDSFELKRQDCIELLALLSVQKESMLPTSNDVYRVALEHGWWKDNRPLPEALLEINGEIDEAFRALKSKNWDEASRKRNLVAELADVVLRAMDIAGSLGFELLDDVVKKHQININRPYRHGK